MTILLGCVPATTRAGGTPSNRTDQVRAATRDGANRRRRLVALYTDSATLLLHRLPPGAAIEERRNAE
ncbi:unnamed protein product [Linum trigynum]|uniref:Uncharacterized protein n=1 Tax=Linum trigynum TaxID=586398 RepID=A0AAV2E231_9ROSI